MAKNYRIPRKFFKTRKYSGKCEKCGTPEPNPVSYVDESNVSITYYAPYLCRSCYKLKYRAA